MKERIYSAAIWYKELPHKAFQLPLNRDLKNPINITSGLVIKGHRHGDIIETVYNLLGLRTVENGENSVGITEQGFVTNKNRYVDRKEAMLIAIEAKQLLNPQTSSNLYSEDIY